MKLMCLLLCLFGLLPFAYALEEGADSLPQEAPKMRPIDRDWAYFEDVPCERINKEVFHSRSEELLLAQRKAQCLNRYKAFFSQPINP